MTIDVERFAFLLRQTPNCTQSPVKIALGVDLHRELRARYKLELGHDLLDDKCANIFNCLIGGGECIGRPLPLDKQIKDAVTLSNCELTIGNYKGKEVYLVKSVTCVNCPFKVGCDSPCATQESFLKRSIKPDMSPKSQMTVNFEDYESGKYGPLLHIDMSDVEDNPSDYSWRVESLPLDCLSPQQRQVIEMITFKNMTQIEIADKLKISQQQVSDQATLAQSRLKKFGLARKVIKESKSTPSRVKLYYIKNLTEQEIADKLKIHQSSVSRTLKSWRTKHGINE